MNRTHNPSQQVAADLVDAINARNAHTTHRAESAVHVLLALLVAIFGVLALLHFGLPCAIEGALCMSLALVTPTQSEPDERLTEALQSSYVQGHNDGEFSGYTEGWRLGLFNGVVIGIGLGALVVFSAYQAGWLFGG